MDRDELTSDDEIGRTEIDLEARLLSPVWHSLAAGGGGGAGAAEVASAVEPRWPLEKRRLYLPGNTGSIGTQGSLTLCVHVLHAADVC